jgi:tetratricopeptide (TPR) repeat protein
MLEKQYLLLEKLQDLSAESSLKLLNKEIALSPEEAMLFFIQGSILADSGEFHQAKLAYFQALDLDPDNEICRLQLALIHFRLGESRQIMYLLSPYLIWQEQNTCQSYMAHSMLAYLQNDFIKSKENIKQALETEEASVWHGVINELEKIYNQGNVTEIKPEDNSIKDTVMTERILDHLYSKTY